MFPGSSNFITGGTFIHHNVNPGKGGFELLREAVAPGAFHNSGERFDPPKCHPNTRLAVLKKIMNWILQQDPDTRDALIMWLYGPAGTGKSAIAQTLAEMCDSERKLLASFFFSRNDSRRGTAQALVATLAYQLCLNLPQQVRDDIVFAIEHDPLLLTRSLDAQLMVLVVEPLNRLAQSGFFSDLRAPRLIIIDGLDECDKSEVQSNMLSAIFQSIQRHRLPVLFLIASRPESDIVSCFDSPSVLPILARLALYGSYGSEEDIRLYLREKFEEIKQTHRLKQYIPISWPGEDVLNKLASNSSGQFIYASTVIKFAGASRRRPTEQLDIILGLHPVGDDAPFAELDALYTEIFSRVDNISHVLYIMVLLIHRPPNMYLMVRFNSAETILGLQPGDASLLLADLGSLISVDGYKFQIQHASLTDFFLDISRSKELCINTPERHTEYALFFFGRLKALNVYLYYTETLEQVFYHHSRALMTEKLQSNIFTLTLDSLSGFNEPQTREAVFEVWTSYFQSSSEDAEQQFFLEQMSLLDEFLLAHLDDYYSNSFLLFTLAVNQDSEYKIDFSLPKASRLVDNSRLALGQLYPDIYPRRSRYRQVLAGLLGDPVRSGRYFLDNTKYAQAAMCALSYLSNHWSHRLPAVRSDLDQHIRRYRPRRWREKWGRHSVLPATMTRMHSHSKYLPRQRGLYDYRFSPIRRPHIYSLYRQDFDGKLYLNQQKNLDRLKDSQGRAVFLFVLRNLPFVLNRAGKSKELIGLACHLKFGPRAKNYPKSTRLAKKAIGEYLTKCADDV